MAGLAVSALGLAVAGSLVLPGAAEPQRADSPSVASTSVPAAVQPAASSPAAFFRDARATRSTARPALSATLTARADQREKTLDRTDRLIRKQARSLAAERERAARAERREAKREARSEAKQTTEASLPVTSGYRIAARFGAVGSWSRYHTGFDFSAAVGTPVRAPSAGVVTTAGGGSAGGWAGTYITISHPDGTSTLYAHLSSVSVSTGDEVSAGEVIGAVGQTGRSFGPHLHFEVYPDGVEPGDVYRAVDPAPWLRDRGLAA